MKFGKGTNLNPPVQAVNNLENESNRQLSIPISVCPYYSLLFSIFIVMHTVTIMKLFPKNFLNASKSYTLL